MKTETWFHVKNGMDIKWIWKKPNRYSLYRHISGISQYRTIYLQCIRRYVQHLFQLRHLLLLFAFYDCFLFEILVVVVADI